MRRRAGFTLMEVLIALFIVGLILGITVSQTERLFDWDMKGAANMLASTIRFLYNKAAMEKLYIRLVFNVDDRTYWVQATADPFVVTREGSEGVAAKPVEKKKEEGKKDEGKEEAPAEGETAEEEKEKAKEEGSEKLKPPEPKFGSVESYLLKPTKLPDSVFIKDLQVEHRKGPIEGGEEAIYFFPNGYVERAIINFRDEEDGIHYSLRTHPISGQVDIEASYRSLQDK